MTEDEGNELLMSHSAWLQALAQSLVAQRDLAADVAQETLVIAWRRGLAGVFDVRSYLAQILRRLANRCVKDEVARRQGEKSSPVRDPAPSTIELVAKASMLREVVDAVLRLDEPYRTAVLLRFLEERSYQEIAAATAAPLETVRTRIKRGLQQLRQDLDRRHGTARAWALPILGYAGFHEAAAAVTTTAASTASVAGAAGAGVLTMAMQTKVALGVAVGVGVLLAAMLAWQFWPASSSVSPVAETNASAAVAVAETRREQALAPAVGVAHGAAAERTDPEVGASALAESEAEGSLLVRVVWADGTPAPRVNVYLASSGPGAFRALAALVSDDAGEARAKVPAGMVQVTSDRAGKVETDVKAGEPQEVRLQLAAGVDVEGTVRNGAGAAVPGADIWLTCWQVPWCAGAFVAKADANGAFSLRAVPKDQSIGAVAAGFAPSPLVDLELCDAKQASVRVELVLAAAGGALAGRVVDAKGTGIEGAIVAVGSSARLTDIRVAGGREERWAPRRGVAGADGRYLIEGLAPGKHPVEVWSRAFAIWRGECTIEAANTAPLEITLLAGVTVHGVVTGEDGEPLADAVVRAFPIAINETFLQGGQYDYESTFGCPFAVADAGGSYRLLRAAPGELHLYAGAGGRRRMGDVVTWANEILHAEPGATLEWSPKIDPGPTIRGVVRYRDGVPMPNVFVSLIEPGQKRRQSVVNGKDGRFRFVRLQKKAYDVSVQLWSPPKGAAPVEAREVWPDTGELELTAAFASPKKQAKGSVRGTVSDAAGRLDSPGALAVILAMNHRSWTTDANLEGAQFHFEDVEPGDVQVVVMNGDDPILVGPWFELQPAEHKDVGTLVTEPGGKLLLNLVRQPGTEALEPVFSFLLAGAMHPRRVTAGKGVTELAIDNLCVGEHRITAYSKGMASIRSKCTIVAGGEARASIELRAAVSREIVVEYAPDQRVTHIRVQEANGAEVYDFAQAGMLDRPYRQKLQLPLGRFTLLVETEGGGVAQREFEMTSLAEDQPPVVLQAK